MRGRDPAEKHRASTPLELFFDLSFASAVALASAELHRSLAGGHIGPLLAGYAAVFFAIWWAWMNFTWFASAYDTDDAPYRLLTLLQMSGALVLAAGVPDAFRDGDFGVIVTGYVIMRLALVTQWLRAAAEHPAGRATALRYALGITAVQAGWVARLWTPEPWGWVTFVAMVLAELAVPAWAELRGGSTPWHAGHIAGRYGRFTVIVLGVVVPATLGAVRTAVSDRGLTVGLLLVAVGGLLLVFSLWWLYFAGAGAALPTLGTALTWGYGHYLVFASVAALGAGLQAALDALRHRSALSERGAALAVAVPVVIVLAVMTLLHRLPGARAAPHPSLTSAGAVVVLGMALAAPATGIGGTVLATGVAVAATLTGDLLLRRRALAAGSG